MGQSRSNGSRVGFDAWDGSRNFYEEDKTHKKHHFRKQRFDNKNDEYNETLTRHNSYQHKEYDLNKRRNFNVDDQRSKKFSENLIIYNHSSQGGELRGWTVNRENLYDIDAIAKAHYNSIVNKFLIIN